MYDYYDTYIVVKVRKTTEGKSDEKARNKKLIFKNNAPFRYCVLQRNNTFIGNVEELDIDLLEYSDIYSMTSGSFWNH